MAYNGAIPGSSYYGTASRGAYTAPQKSYYSATGGSSYSDIEASSESLFPGITQADQARAAFH